VAVAFLIVFVTVPALRIVSFVRRRIDVQIPLVTDVDSYEIAVEIEIKSTLVPAGMKGYSPWRPLHVMVPRADTPPTCMRSRSG
jgi:hypothetical protein